MSKYICWQRSLTQTINIIESNNPLSYYKKESSNMFLKVVMIRKKGESDDFEEKMGFNSCLRHENHYLMRGSQN